MTGCLLLWTSSYATGKLNDMITTAKRPSSAESLAAISNVVISAFIVVTLYLGRAILVPVALAALLTFLLSPLASWLQRWIGRIGAILLVVFLLLATTYGVGWVVTRQAIDLAEQIPSYKANIQTKLRAIRLPNHGPIAKVSATLEDLKKDLPEVKKSAQDSADPKSQSEEQATPVKIVGEKEQPLKFIQVVLAPFLGPLGTAALVLLLLIFMLLQREDLRSRIIRLIGQERVSTTTHVMDEASAKVTKYLLMQLVVNVTYGIPVAIGLSLIGVPNAILWGALAIVLRFIPYLGPWIAASFPVLLALASSPGWMVPLLTIALFVVLELISNNIMEPWLYGSSTGVTPIALIIAALVWTSLWGPVGLLLSTPLTVCMVVMGRHIPRLEFFSIMMSDEEVLTPAEDCYQRLIRAGEHDEMELVEQYLKANSLKSLFDSVLIPVLFAASDDHRHGYLDPQQFHSVQLSLSEVVEAVSPDDPTGDEMDCNIYCVPAKGSFNQLASEMITRLLWEEGLKAKTATPKMLPAEIMDCARAAKAVCVSAMAPRTITYARHLCAKLRATEPNLEIIVGLWGWREMTPQRIAAFKEAGADQVVSSMAEVVDRFKAQK